jgi:anti-sigma B factor antagonist
MELSICEYRRADVITIRGRVDSLSAEQLSQAIERSHQQGKYNLVLDVSQVEFVSSAGLRTLIEAQRHTTALGWGEITLAQVPPRLEELLDMTGLSRDFRTFETVAAALAYASQGL